MEITRKHPAVAEHHPMIVMIANGSDIWSKNAPDYLVSYRQYFLTHYSAFPTNNHNVERGVRESGYVTLGNRSEEHRSIYVIARGSVIPEALELGKKEINDNKKKVQGKKRHHYLYEALNNHNTKLPLKIKTWTLIG